MKLIDRAYAKRQLVEDLLGESIESFLTHHRFPPHSYAYESTDTIIARVVPWLDWAEKHYRHSQVHLVRIRYGIDGGEWYSYKEVAELLAIKPSLAASRIRRGISRLRHPESVQRLLGRISLDDPV